MLNDDRALRRISSEVGKATSSAEASYRNGDAPYEVDITGRLLGALEARLDKREIKGIHWRAKQFKTGRGSGAEEKRTGADFMGFLDLQVDQLTVQKGFLAQAKRVEPNQPISDWDRAVEQLEKMLAISPASFLFAYSKAKGIKIFPAIEVVGLKSKDVFDLYDQTFRTFFENYLKCFIGDRQLTVPNIEGFLSDASDRTADVPAAQLLIVSGKRD